MRDATGREAQTRRQFLGVASAFALATIAAACGGTTTPPPTDAANRSVPTAASATSAPASPTAPVGATASPVSAAGTPGAIGTPPDVATAVRGVPGTPGAAVRLDNCGTQASFPTAPQRVITLTSAPIDFLYALGLDGRIVGTGYRRSGDEVAPELAPVYARVPGLSEGMPSKEAILAQRPDLIYAPGSSLLSAKNGLDRDTLLADGIAAYAGAVGCRNENPRVTLDDTYTELTDLGRIFRIDDRARSVVEALRVTVADVAARRGGGRRPRVWAYGGTQFTWSGSTVANAAITLAGGQNIWADGTGDLSQWSAEAVVARDPEVIWLVTYFNAGREDSQSPDALAAQLATLPAIADLAAVRNRRFVAVRYQEGTQPNPRNADAVRTIARALYPERFQ